jgi:hypothetical protein
VVKNFDFEKHKSELNFSLANFSINYTHPEHTILFFNLSARRLILQK